MKYVSSHLGKTLSMEHRKKISIAGMGRTLSIETRNKMREVALVREANKRAGGAKHEVLYPQK